MPSESDVFGSIGGKPSVNGGAPGNGGTSGASGTDERGGSESTAGTAGVAPNGSAGMSGLAGAMGPSGGSTGFDPAQGLVAYFTFDESSGTGAADAKDSTKSAKCVGSCTHPDGQLGRAFGIRNSEGPSAWIELPRGLFADRSSITLSVWLRDLSTSRDAAPLFHFSSSTSEAFYLSPNDRSASARGIHLGGQHNGKSFVDLWSGTPSLTDREWHHLVVAWSVASIELYVDGKSVANAQNPRVMPSQLGATSIDYLGRARDDGTPGLFGEIDDLRVYDRVLPASEVKQLYALR